MLPSLLWRSVLRTGEEPEEALGVNLGLLRQELELDGIDQTIFKFVTDLYDRSHEVPRLQLVYQHFQRLEQQGDGSGAAAVLRLSTVLAPSQPLPTLIGADFRYALDLYRKELLREATSQLLLDGSTILTAGMSQRVLVEGKWEDRTLHGPEAAIDYLVSRLASINARTRRGSIEGDFRKEGEHVRRQYAIWESHPESRVGVLSGLAGIDASHRGIKVGELALVLGFVSHLKSAFCLNWLYKAAVWQGRNVAIASLEMSTEILRTLLYTMHSTHRKFSEQGFPAINHDRVLAGTLTPEEKRVYELVIEDLASCPEYGRIYYKEPQGAVTVADIRAWAETKHQQTPLDLLVVDYVGLVDPGIKRSSLEQASNLNMTLRQTKQMAMAFAGGRGIAVLSPFQANREGLKDAQKNGGRYQLTALSTANESERSADLVYYVYLDDTLRNARELIVGNLKNRNGPVFTQQLRMFADPASRVIENLDRTEERQRWVRDVPDV